MPGPLLGLLLRGAMGAAAGTTRLAAMAGRRGGGLLGRSAVRGGARKLFGGDDDERAQRSPGLLRHSMAPRVSPRRVDTPEMAKVRERIRSPLATAEQRQSDRNQLAVMLKSQRNERKRIRKLTDPGRINKFVDGLKEGTFSLGKFRVGAMTMATGSLAAADGFRRLAVATNDSAIQNLRSVSPAMAALASKADVFRMRQGAIEGEGTSESAKRLQEQQQRLERAKKPFYLFFKNLGNEVGAKTTDWKATALELFDEFVFTDWVSGANGVRVQKQAGDRGPVLKTLDSILANGLHNDPNLMNRRPNEKPGGRM